MVTPWSRASMHASRRLRMKVRRRRSWSSASIPSGTSPRHDVQARTSQRFRVAQRGDEAGRELVLALGQRRDAAIAELPVTGGALISTMSSLCSRCRSATSFAW
jgi:hypothetical protein